MKNSTAKPLIVAVDDTRFVCDTLTTWLKDIYDIKTFLSGDEAISFLSENQVDLFLLDYDMPEMTGYEVLMNIRQNLNYSTKVPVIFLTAVTNDRMEQEMLERGANAYIRKPLDLNVLKRTIVKYLNEKL
ncbi:MAG: response regulator [Lachnospiraceae bacterium]|nr:response regulator [Lachnospiraceae bacterium]